jgi:large subunit ribosomal protein L34e
MVQRVVYRRQNNFNTRSNKVKKVKTPGGVVKVQYLEKRAKGPRCGDCKCEISGVPQLRSYAYKGLSKNQRTVSRAYGGSRCGGCVRERVIRAFLIEEQKCVKAFMAEKEREVKAKKVEETKQTSAPKKAAASKSKSETETKPKKK